MLVHSAYLFIQQILGVPSTEEIRRIIFLKSLTFRIYVLMRVTNDKQHINNLRQ